MAKRLVILILLLFLIYSATPVSAQTPTPASGPIYVVQEGDTLWGIASLFNVSVNEIQTRNNLATQDIFVGDKLVIPGMDGLSGLLAIKPVHFGDTLQSLSRQYRVPPDILRRINHIISPTELFVGDDFIVLQQDDQSAMTNRTSLGQAETMLELAIKAGSDPWTIAQINGITNPSANLPGDILYLPGGKTSSAPSGLPDVIVSAEVDPLPLRQGMTAQIKVVTSQPVTLGGMLVDKSLHFLQVDSNTQVALQGIHAMLDPGVYPLRLDATKLDGSIQSFEQMVLVRSAEFPTDPALEVDPSTIDPAVTGPEDQWLLSVTSVFTPEKYWNGVFLLPVDSQYCIRSGFGDRRSYNGGALHSFHTGLDYGVCSQSHPFDIYATADGVVVFTGTKTVRGNATIIDHGQGIFSAYYHQDEAYVKIGDHVTAGQLIGKIGTTGRVTGAHLHFEIWVNGIQVSPLQWLAKAYPH